jgi:hypothetical protein
MGTNGQTRQHRSGMLDRDDPVKVIGRLRDPLIVPNHDEREG